MNNNFSCSGPGSGLIDLHSKINIENFDKNNIKNYNSFLDNCNTITSDVYPSHHNFIFDYYDESHQYEKQLKMNEYAIYPWVQKKPKSSTPINQPVNYPVNNQKNRPLNNKQKNRPLNNNMNQPTNHPINHSINHPINQPTNHHMNHPINHPIKQPTNQPINHPLNEHINNYNNPESYPIPDLPIKSTFLNNNNNDFSSNNENNNNDFSKNITIRDFNNNNNNYNKNIPLNECNTCNKMTNVKSSYELYRNLQPKKKKSRYETYVKNNIF
jgi:hypothetical protein